MIFVLLPTLQFRCDIALTSNNDIKIDTVKNNLIIKFTAIIMFTTQPDFMRNKYNLTQNVESVVVNWQV